jgi:hypothetical protein
MIHRRASALLLAGALFGLALAAPAAAEAEPPAPRISLLTFDPGAVYWQRFGHNALLVRDGIPGSGTVYNYGFFDFAQESFFANFIFGRMQYRLATDTLARTLYVYAREGRAVREQRLDLRPAQARELADFLEWNARPENAAYRYDYFRRACSTQLRDALDEVTDGALQVLKERPARLTLRGQVLRLTAPDLPLMLGLDLILGPAADLPRTRWEEAFVPEVLEAALRDVALPATEGAPARPLVAAERVLVPRDEARAAAVPPEDPPHLAGWFLLAGLLWSALLVLACRYARPLWALLGGLQLLLAGAAGLIMAFITVATAHWAGWYNLSMAFYNPLAWLAFPALWVAARGRIQAPWQRFFMLLLPAVALLGALAPIWQANLHHLLFWLPAHAALAWSALRLPDTR